MYAIVRAGGRQEKVSVGDVLIIDKVNGEAGDSIDLTPLLLVDGSTVTSDAGKLAKVKVTAADGYDLLGKVVGAVSISGPSYRLTPESFPTVAPQLLSGADEISTRLGYYPT